MTLSPGGGYIAHVCVSVSEGVTETVNPHKRPPIKTDARTHTQHSPGAFTRGTETNFFIRSRRRRGG